jgi:thermitase
MKLIKLFILLFFVYSFKTHSDLLSYNDWGIRNAKISEARSLMTNKCSESEVLVGIVDTGIDVKHPELKSSIWKNPNPIKMNFFGDMDKNGWDFNRDRNIEIDSHGHGTHIAGIISGANGICPGIKIINMAYYNPQGTMLNNMRNSMNSIQYLINKGVKIINYSAGGAEFSVNEYDLINKAKDAGILFIAAAGNEGKDSSLYPYYPASYQLDNIISVGAINQEDILSGFSNFGIKTVDIAAPGSSILSTLPGNSRGYMTGTSQATAFVTGVAALLLTENPKLTVKQVKDLILKYSTKVSGLRNKTKYGSKLNALECMKGLIND